MEAKTLKILFGSETGTAEYVSEEIGRELYKRKISFEIFALDNYKITELPEENVVIFVISTAGFFNF